MAVRVFTVQAQAFYGPSTAITKTVTDSAIVSDEVDFAIQGVNDTLRDAETNMVLNNLVALEHVRADAEIVEDQLNLVQIVHVQDYEQVEDDLGLVQTVDYQGPINLDTENPLNLQAEASFVYGLRSSYPVEHELGLEQTVVREVPLTILQGLGLSQEAFVSQVEEQPLNLVETVEWGYGIDVEQDIGLTDLAEVDKILNQNVTNADVVDHAMTYFIESPCATKQRNGFHGVGGVAPADPRLEYANTFLIQSSSNPSDILVLRNPETDNRRRYQFQRVNRDLMDGSIDMFRDPSWPIQETQIYTIVALKRATLDDLHTFLQNYLGEEVLIKDWKGVTWKVIITNPGEVYTEDSEDYWTVDFEVVGQALDGEWVAHKIDFTETLSRSGSIWTRQMADSSVVSDTLEYTVE